MLVNWQEYILTCGAKQTNYLFDQKEKKKKQLTDNYESKLKKLRNDISNKN